MISNAKPTFINEVSDLLEDCDEYEIRVITDLIKSTKLSLRTRKNILIKDCE